MGYYHILIDEDASNLCMSIIIWGKYCYNCITMGVHNSPEMFQIKINDLFQTFGFIHSCIDGPFMLTKGYCADHVNKLELTLNKLKKSYLNKILKSISLETRNGIFRFLGDT